MLTVGSLFSGIGGFDLGLERTGGFRTAWFCEQDPFCQHVLAQHWPGVPIHDDITQLRHPEPVDVLCGGFPCQDLSLAGKGAGLAGARSGLWTEYARLIGELRPRYVLVENVSALLARGLGVVLGDLAALGYDAEWDCIPASAVGAPHRRDRIWLVAYPEGSEGWRGAVPRSSGDGRSGVHGEARLAAYANGEGKPGVAGNAQQGPGLLVPGRGRGGAHVVDDPMRGRHGTSQREVRPGRHSAFDPGWWATEPDVGRVADGVPARVDRLRALGNALVPQIAEWIGGRVITYETAAASPKEPS